MPRSIASATQNKLGGSNIFVADLIEIHFGTTVYYNTSRFNISYDSSTAPDSGTNIYLAQGKFLGYGRVKETTDLRVNAIDLTLSAVDTTTTTQLMNNDFIDKRVVIYRALLNNDLSFTAQDIWMIFDGFITGYAIKESQATSTVTITVASQFADFERTNGRRTNPASQNIHFPDDRGLDFAPELKEDIKWGRP